MDINKKTYDELTPGEKQVVGLIYESYLSYERYVKDSKYNHLKEAVFEEFVNKYMKYLDTDLKFYADYEYVDRYELSLGKNIKQKNALSKFLDKTR